MSKGIWKAILDNTLVRSISDGGGGNPILGQLSMSLNDLTIIVKYQSSDAPA